MTGELPPRVVAGISFIGRAGGQVKALGGFRKGHHTLPDAANATTNAFLGKICAAELAERAEALFQRVRTELGYKRKDVSLGLASPVAVLTARDFTVEIAYALEEKNPAGYEITSVLRHLRSAELARTAEFSRIFARAFGEISFALTSGARVEAVIDAIEALKPNRGLTASYPSDCRECSIGVAGLDAQVRFTGATLDLVFAQPGSPSELMEGFAAVRTAFAVSPELAGLLG
ncbi:MAG TPA: hypothetical protein VG838_01555 [Opitutaceae bacterium]|nr:hypothetical protein [Opitutaceae bacterium]